MSDAALICDAHLVEFDPPSVERGDLRVRDGKIVERGEELLPGDEEVIDFGGDVLLPGLVNAHMHLYSSLAVGMPAPSVSSFEEALDKVWWPLDRALEPSLVEASAQAGLLGALQAGCTTVVDHHASPEAISGSLSAIAGVAEGLGVRVALAYELTDRNGPEGFSDGLEENAEAIERYRGPFCRSILGLHAGFTLSDLSLKRAATVPGPIHIHAGESLGDVEYAKNQGFEGPVSRLLEAGILRPGSLLAHGVHLTDEEVQRALEAKAWIIHNPTSNRNNQVGYAYPGRFGDRGCLGTDGIGSDMFQAAKEAFFAAREHRHSLDVLGLFRANHRLASELMGVPLGRLQPGYEADLVRLRNACSTPLTGENLAGHLLFGFHAGQVEDVWVAGRRRLKSRVVQGLDVRYQQGRLRRSSKALWEAYLRELQS